MDFETFEKILNAKIFDNSKKDLIKKIAENPARYIGLFRPTKPKAKILQNILQSNEICFWDAMESIFEVYFEILGFKNLEKIIKIKNPESEKSEYLDLDQLFSDENFIYFIEQKVRDDHDSTKKRWQMENFEKKIIELQKIYDEKKIRAFMYFIDPTLIKNKSYYQSEINDLVADYEIPIFICYWAEFWEKIEKIEVWEEVLQYLQIWKQKIPDLPTINFDENPEKIFEEIKDIPIPIYRKLFNNEELCKEILPIISPEKQILKNLQKYFSENPGSIYKNLSEKIENILETY